MIRLIAWALTAAVAVCGVYLGAAPPQAQAPRTLASLVPAVARVAAMAHVADAPRRQAAVGQATRSRHSAAPPTTHQVTAATPAAKFKGHKPPTAKKPIPLLTLPVVLPDRSIQVPILMYHHVSSAPPATDLNYGLTVTDADFASQLNYLSAHGYHVVLLDRVFAALYRGIPLPSHPVVLTFDDGYTDNYTDARPILLKHHMHAEFNVISAYVGTTLGVNSYMSWKHLQSMVSDGMQIGSHTVDHEDLGVLPDTKIRFELRDSRNLLQQKLGVPVQFLAYPAGQPFARGDTGEEQRVLTLMPQYGYVGALLDGPLTTGSQHARTPFQLNRIRVSGGESLAAFAASLQS